MLSRAEVVVFSWDKYKHVNTMLAKIEFLNFQPVDAPDIQQALKG
jgi:hypothetical protein